MIAVALGVGLLPTVSPDIYARTPGWFQTIFDSGISSGALAAIVLHRVLCASTRTPEQARGAVVVAGAGEPVR